MAQTVAFRMSQRRVKGLEILSKKNLFKQKEHLVQREAKMLWEKDGTEVFNYQMGCV